jgi:hypothetical protein
LLYLLIGCVVLASLAGAAWTLWERNRHDPWLRLLDRASAHLKQTGVSVAPYSPPRRIAEQLLKQVDPKSGSTQMMADWLVRLEAQRYGPESAQRTGLATLQRELKQLIRLK